MLPVQCARWWLFWPARRRRCFVRVRTTLTRRRRRRTTLRGWERRRVHVATSWKLSLARLPPAHRLAQALHTIGSGSLIGVVYLYSTPSVDLSTTFPRCVVCGLRGLCKGIQAGCCAEFKTPPIENKNKFGRPSVHSTIRCSNPKFVLFC